MNKRNKLAIFRLKNAIYFGMVIKTKAFNINLGQIGQNLI